MIDYWPLLGIALVVVGFALRFNPLLVVAVAAIATGLLGGNACLKVLAARQGLQRESQCDDHLYRLAGHRRARTLRAAAAGAGADRRDARGDDGPAADRLPRLPASPCGARPDHGCRTCADRPAFGRADGIAAAEKQHGSSTRIRPSGSKPWPLRPTMSACSSARTSFSRSPRSC